MFCLCASDAFVWYSWRTAFDESWEYVYTVLDSAADPQLRPDTLASISLASHICVLLLSDDNVSTEVGTLLLRYLKPACVPLRY